MPGGVMPRRPAPPLPPLLPPCPPKFSNDDDEVFELHIEEPERKFEPEPRLEPRLEPRPEPGLEAIRSHESLGPSSSSKLHRAISGKNPSTILHLLQRSTPDEVLARHGPSHATLLHTLVSVVSRPEQEKCLPIVYQLSNAGADMNAVDAANRTPLQMAIDKGLTLFMVALIRCGVDLCERDYQAMVRNSPSQHRPDMQDVLDKYTPGLWAAVGSGSTGIANLLINSWCRINIYKRLGGSGASGVMSLMTYAQRSRQPPEMLALLDDYEVTIEFVHATLAGDEIRMQDFLMDSKPCDPYIMDIAHQDRSDAPLLPRSLRDAAIAMGHTHVLHLLPEGSYESAEKSTRIKDTSVASCSDYSSGSITDSFNPKSDSVTDYSSRNDRDSGFTPVPKPDPKFDPVRQITSSDYPSRHDRDSAQTSFPDPKFDPVTQIQTDTQFMTIGRAPRLSTFRTTEPITAAPDRHYVQGFYFHEPEPEPEVEHVFQGGDASIFNTASPMGSIRSHRTYGNYHDYSKNWTMPAPGDAKDRKGKDKGSKDKDKDKDKEKTKSKLCVIM